MKKRSKKMRQRRQLLIGCSILVVLLLVFLISYFVVRSAVNKAGKDTIWKNITIEQIDVSGMKAEEAKAAVEAKLTEYQAAVVELVAEGTTTEVTLGELGFDIKEVDELVEDALNYGKKGSVWSRYKKLKGLKKSAKDFDAVYTIDSETTQTVIAEKIPHLENEAKDATISRQNGTFVITDGEKGRKINLEESVAVIESYFNNNWEYKGNESIELVTEVADPNVTREDLEQIKDVLGSFSTNCGGSASRLTNIDVATKYIDGTVVMPGETFSTNAVIKERNAANGYKEAGSYENGETVQTYGGGICQVSTTLYNAVLFAELEVVERSAHSMSVSYVEPSKDAAISGTYKDFKFKNDTDAPIYVEGWLSGRTLTYKIYGKDTRAEGRVVKYVSEVLSTTESTKKFVASSDALGTIKKTSSGHTGMKAKLWKVVTENGQEVSRETVNSSSYQASASTYAVGTASDNAGASQIVSSAISSNNESTIQAAISQAQAKIAADKAAAEQQQQQQQQQQGTTTPPADGATAE